MGTRILQIDAFAERPFAGNPAAVCLLDVPAGPDWMQRVAAEMNLSETAFLLRRDDGWGLRWFTPAVEVDLCGHATLAAAHALWEENLAPADEQIRFHTLSGLLTCARRDGAIEMDFPAGPVERAIDGAGTAALAAALGADIVAAHRSGWMNLVEVADASVVRAISPDMAALREAPSGNAIVTAASDTAEYDFVSRFFVPSVGVDEDPVTGSAHCVLGPFWAARLGKRVLVGYQASARGGVVHVKVEGDRVRLAGQAVTVLRGELL